MPALLEAIERRVSRIYVRGKHEDVTWLSAVRPRSP
jgi:hypothetical protein